MIIKHTMMMKTQQFKHGKRVLLTLVPAICLVLCQSLLTSANAQVAGQNTANFPNLTADNYISIPNSALLSSTAAITVEAWINIAAKNSDAGIICKGTGGGGEAYSLDLGGGALGTACARFYVHNSTGGTFVSTNATSIVANTWYHLAGVYNGSSVILYINEVAGSSVGTTGTLMTNTHLVSIGARQSASAGYDMYVQGKIDEVRIWNVARTATQIQDNMFRQLVTFPTANLVAYYQFNGASNQYNDLSGNSNNGTLTGTVQNVASTAPIPFYTIAATAWNVATTWAAGQGIPPSATYTDVWINNNVSNNAIRTIRDLTITNSAVLSDAGFQITSAGTLNLTSGTLKLGAGTATTWPGFGTNNISAGTTVEYASTAAQAVLATPAYQHLTFSGNSTKTASGGLTVNGNLTINAGTFAGGSFTHNLAGDWINNGAFTASTSTINLMGANAVNIGGTATTTFNNLTINKNASATTVTSASGAKAFTVSSLTTSNLTITQGNLILQAIDANYAVSNDLTISANGTLTHSVSWDTNGKLLLVGGNIAIDGIFTYTTRSHVQMTGSTKNVRTGANASSAFSILTLASGGVINASGILHVKDNFWAMFGTAGSFHTNGQNVTADASVLINNGSTVVDGGTLNVSGGVQVGTGTNGALTISSGILNTDVLTLGNGTQTGTVTQTGGTCNISGSLLINPSCSYTCQNSPAINLGGNWTNNGSFTSATSTVSFNGSAQVIGGSAATNFNNLTFSGSGIKAFGAARTISGSFSINTGVKANLGTFTSSTNTLVLGGSATAGGSWGSSSSPANNTNDIFFTATTGIINVTTSSCSGSITTSFSQSNIACFGGSDGTITISASGGTGPYTYSIHNGTPASTYQPVNIFTGLGPGVYQIRVKDANGCESKLVQ